MTDTATDGVAGEVPLVFECFGLNPWGSWASFGVADGALRDILAHFQPGAHRGGRLRICRVELEGDLVTIWRCIRVSGVEIERTECLFHSAAEAVAAYRELNELADEDYRRWGSR